MVIGALACLVAFSACNESKDDHPVLKPVEEGTTQNFLNTPVMANATLDLTRENESGYIHMTCSQPEAYGFAAPVRYTVQMALSQDFATFWTLSSTFSDCSEINPINGEVAEGMCKLLGYENESQVPSPYMPVYFRLVAEIVGATGAVTPGTTITSNVVSIAEVCCNYLAVIVPDMPTGIYVRGSINGWDALPEYEFVTTNERDVYIFRNITLAENDEWKIADSSWGDINLGIGSDAKLEVNVPVELASGGGNIKMEFAFSGNIRLEKKGNKYVMTLQSAGAPSGIYFRGDMNGWDAAKNWEFLTTDADNVLKLGNVTLDPSQGFKVADKDWGAINYGGTAPVIPGTEYVLVYNGENLNVSDAFTGTAILTKTEDVDADGHAVYTLLLTTDE